MTNRPYLLKISLRGFHTALSFISCPPCLGGDGNPLTKGSVDFFYTFFLCCQYSLYRPKVSSLELCTRKLKYILGVFFNERPRVFEHIVKLPLGSSTEWSNCASGKLF